MSGETTKDWYPGGALTALWTVLSIVLVIAGFVGFLAIYALRGGDSMTIDSLLEFLLIPIGVIALIVMHEWIHGLTMRRFRATPVYGVGVMHRVVPYFSCTAPGFRFTRNQFIAVSLAPFITISLTGALAILVIGEQSGWLVIALAIHAGGCIGDLWGAGLALRHPGSTLFEDLKTGVRIIRPSTASR